MFHLLILISVLFAGLHAGEQEFAGHDRSDQHAVHLAVVAHDEAPQESGVGGPHEGLHHHHCPIGAWIDRCGDTELFAVASGILRPGAAHALASLEAEPPVDPPLA